MIIPPRHSGLGREHYAYVYLFISSAGFYCALAESFGVRRATGRRDDRGFCPSPAVVSGTGEWGSAFPPKMPWSGKGEGRGPLCTLLRFFQ